MDPDLMRVVGFADGCELMAAAFAFPAPALAAALCDGSFLQDAQDCLADVGAVAKSADALKALYDAEPDQVFDDLRAAHTTLYLLPGGEAALWPYEAAFRHDCDGRLGLPALFRSPCQLDVERHMREAGVMPVDARREPSDSVWSEFSFLSYLYGSLAAALHEGRGGDAARWRVRITAFWSEHGSQWLPAFMRQTQAEAPALPQASPYAAFAAAGLALVEAIGADVTACSERGCASGGEDGCGIG